MKNINTIDLYDCPGSDKGMHYETRCGDLVKILWHDGLGMSLYAKRLDRGKFIWPSASAGAVSISAAQMAYMLEGIDWRNPQLSWRPQSAG
jgi:transposase